MVLEYIDTLLSMRTWFQLCDFVANGREGACCVRARCFCLLAEVASFFPKFRPSPNGLEHDHRVADRRGARRVRVRVALIAAEYDDVVSLDPPRLARCDEIDDPCLASQVFAAARRVRDADEA